MARKRGSNNEEPKQGSPAWMNTYGDMVTLLLCFFVLLFSFSEVNAKKFDALIESFQGSLGILDSGTAIESDDLITEAMKNDLTTNQKQELEDFRNLQESLEDYLKNSGLESDILVTHENAGLVLRFKDNVLFDPGQAILKQRSKKILTDIVTFLEAPEFIDKSIRVEGHTDTVRSDPTSLYPTNWELSAGRASNVVRYLVEESDLEPKRLAIAGYGEYHPIAPNDTAENRSKNRRVDIVILRSEYIISES